MKVYIAGAITGVPDYRDRFSIAKKALEREGHTVLNPAALPEGMEKKDYMRICFAMIDTADVITFLPNWENSKGANVERAYVTYIEKPILQLESLTAYQNAVLVRDYRKIIEEEPEMM